MANNDLISQYFRDNGFTGTLQDMEKQLFQLGGPMFIGMGGNKKRILAIGDSIVEYGQSFGRVMTPPTLVTGVISQGASLNWPSGAATLTYIAATGLLSIQAFGDTVGPGVDVSQGGVFYLQSGNPAYSFRVGVKRPLLPTTNQTESLTPGATQWLRATGGWLYAIDALTKHKFQFLPPLGISGDTTVGMVSARYAQALSSSAEIILDEGGTNDIQLSPQQLPATIVANRSQFWRDCGRKGKTVLAFLISPRWGRDENGTPAADAAKYTATLQARLVATNRLLIAAAADMPWVHIVDTYSPCTDPAQGTGRVRDGWTPAGDGLHPGGAMALYGYAIPAAKILNTLVPEDISVVNIGGGSYYDAVNNPGGNLLNSNQGALAGTGGAPGTGVIATPAWITATGYTAGTYVISSGNLYYTSAGGLSGATAPVHSRGTVSDGAVLWEFQYSGVVSGLASGVSSSRIGANISATAHKVASTDGGPDWQAFLVKGAVLNTEQIGLYLGNPTFSRVAVGDTLSFQFEFQVIGSGCYGVYGDYTLTGASYAVEAKQLRNVFAGIRDMGGVIATEPYVLQSGITDIFPRIFVQSLVGAQFEVRYRNVDLRKVL